MKNIEVCAAILFKDGKILVVERGYGEFKDRWEFPGGKLEKNESLKECIIREIKEEMDCLIDPFFNLGYIEYDYPTFHLKMNLFLAHFLTEFKLLEHEDKKFISLDELDDVDFLEADRLVIPLIKNYFKTNPLK